MGGIRGRMTGLLGASVLALGGCVAYPGYDVASGYGY